jgi:hypothetical protein
MLAKYKITPAQLLGLAPICAIHRRGAPAARIELNFSDLILLN